MKKRIISAALASLMAVSALSTSAFAELAKADGSVTGTGTTAIPTLKVTLPKALNYVVNPYKMVVDAKGKAVAEPTYEGEGNDRHLVDGQYDSQVIAVYDTDKTSWDLINNSGIAIKANIYATVKNGNAAQLAINPPASGEGALTADQKKTMRQLNLTLNSYPITVAAADDAENNIHAGDLIYGTTATAITLLDAAPDSWTAAGKTTTINSIANGAGVAFKLSGTTVTDTTYEGSEWTAKDSATIGLYFKFAFVANS